MKEDDLVRGPARYFPLEWDEPYHFVDEFVFADHELDSVAELEQHARASVVWAHRVDHSPEVGLAEPLMRIERPLSKISEGKKRRAREDHERFLRLSKAARERVEAHPEPELVEPKPRTSTMTQFTPPDWLEAHEDEMQRRLRTQIRPRSQIAMKPGYYHIAIVDGRYVVLDQNFVESR